MANTTNYNWETPDDTDLVKDGAAAIRTLGSSIDTTTKALNPSTTLGDIEYRSATANTNTRLGIGTTGQILSVVGGVPAWVANDVGDITEVQAGTGISVASGTGPVPVITNTVATAIDAAGDLLYGSAADTVTRLAIGTAGQILKVNSGATAPEWGAAPSGGGFTLLDTKTFDNSVTNYTFTSISGSYKHLYVIGEGMQSNATSGTATGFNVELVGDSAGNYFYSKVRSLGTSVSCASADGDTKFLTGNCLNDTNDTNGFGSMEFIIYNYAGTANYKSVISRVFCGINTASGSTEASWNNGTYNATTAISSIKFTNTGAVNLKSGTLKLYGVS
jgi:hypothetical protein